MKKVYLITGFICIHVVFAILLIHKQNLIISLLYDVQKLQEQKEQLTQEKKELFFALQKEQQLSHIQSFADKQLQMKPLTIKEAKTVSLKRNSL